MHALSETYCDDLFNGEDYIRHTRAVALYHDLIKDDISDVSTYQQWLKQKLRSLEENSTDTSPHLLRLRQLAALTTDSSPIPPPASISLAQCKSGLEKGSFRQMFTFTRWFFDLGNTNDLRAWYIYCHQVVNGFQLSLREMQTSPFSFKIAENHSVFTKMCFLHSIALFKAAKKGSYPPILYPHANNGGSQVANSEPPSKKFRPNHHLPSQELRSANIVLVLPVIFEIVKATVGAWDVFLTATSFELPVDTALSPFLQFDYNLGVFQALPPAPTQSPHSQLFLHADTTRTFFRSIEVPCTTVPQCLGAKRHHTLTKGYSVLATYAADFLSDLNDFVLRGNAYSSFTTEMEARKSQASTTSASPTPQQSPTPTQALPRVASGNRRKAPRAKKGVNYLDKASIAQQIVAKQLPQLFVLGDETIPARFHDLEQDIPPFAGDVQETGSSLQPAHLHTDCNPDGGASTGQLPAGSSQIQVVIPPSEQLPDPVGQPDFVAEASPQRQATPPLPSLPRQQERATSPPLSELDSVSAPHIYPLESTPNDPEEPNDSPIVAPEIVDPTSHPGLALFTVPALPPGSPSVAHEEAPQDDEDQVSSHSSTSDSGQNQTQPTTIVVDPNALPSEYATAKDILEELMTASIVMIRGDFEQVYNHYVDALGMSFNDSITGVLTDPPYNYLRAANGDVAHDMLTYSQMNGIVNMFRDCMSHGAVLSLLEMLRDDVDDPAQEKQPSFEIVPYPLHIIKTPGHYHTPPKHQHPINNTIEYIVLGRRRRSGQKLPPWHKFKNANHLCSEHEPFTDLIDNVHRKTNGETLMVPNPHVPGSSRPLRREQKLEKLEMERLDRFMPSADIIYDPFFGTGTTAVACLRVEQQRLFLGTEADQDCCTHAEARVLRVLAEELAKGHFNLHHNKAASKKLTRLARAGKEGMDKLRWAAEVFVRYEEKTQTASPNHNRWCPPQDLPAFTTVPPGVIATWLDAVCDDFEDAPLRGKTLDSWPNNVNGSLSGLPANHINSVMRAFYRVRRSPSGGVRTTRDIAENEIIGYAFGHLVYHNLSGRAEKTKLYGRDNLLINVEHFTRFNCSMSTPSLRGTPVSTGWRGAVERNYKNVFLVPDRRCLASFCTVAEAKEANITVSCQHDDPSISTFTSYQSYPIRATTSIQAGEQLILSSSGCSK